MGEGGDIAGEAPSHGDHYLEDYPERPWLLAGLGGLAGLIIHLLLDVRQEVPWQAATAAGLFFTFAAASFVLTPRRWIESALFSIGLGVVMGGVAWLAIDSGDRVSGEEFGFAAGVFFSLLAVPLFQSDFHRRRWATPYRETHFHVWTDAVTAGGALLFVLLSWLLLWLLHALFSLIGIEVIEDLIDADGFIGLFCGATYGAAMGVLRNQLGIIGTLQRVVMLVFSLLAVPFAFAILIFLVALLLSGGTALWEATDSATPILLACALGCFVLANAVVRDDDESRSDNVVMQAAALVLAFSIFPLTVFAAISMGIRIDQYGLSPERLWALVAIMIATAYGLAYWVGLARGRLAGWSHYLRRANLHLAAASCVIALLLALPLVNFSAISARQQVARLNAGEVTPEEFDFAAIRWDFGDAGRKVLDDLAESDNASVAELAQATLEMESRPYGPRSIGQRDAMAQSIDMDISDAAVEAAIRAYIRDQVYLCSPACRVKELGQIERGTLVALLPGEGYQVLPELLLVEPGGERAVKQRITNGRLLDQFADIDRTDEADGEIELRPFTGQQVFVGERPASQPFE